jgi:hypothetical protein
MVDKAICSCGQKQGSISQDETFASAHSLEGELWQDSECRLAVSADYKKDK